MVKIGGAEGREWCLGLGLATEGEMQKRYMPHEMGYSGYIGLREDPCGPASKVRWVNRLLDWVWEYAEELRCR